MKTYMKKCMAALLVVMLMVTSFTACSSKDEGSKEPGSSGPVTDQQNPADGEGNETDGDDQTPDDDDKDEDEDQDKEDDNEKDEDKTDKQEKNDKTSSSSKDTSSSSTSKPAGSSSSKPADKPSSDKKDDKKDDDKKEEAKAPKGTPAEIIDKIYEKKSVDLSLGTMDVDLSNSDMVKAVTGLSSADKIKSAAYSESLMGSQAYSLVVVRVKDSKDAESVASSMLEGIDPRKWICVEADDVRVAAKDDVVVLFMVDSQFVSGKDIIKAFKSLCGGSLDVSMKR